MAEEKNLLGQTITIRASDEFKKKLLDFVAEASKEVDSEIKISDLVRLGLDWALLHTPTRIVDFLVGDEPLGKHL